MERDKSFTWAPQSAEPLNATGKKVIVVGGTGGLGRAISRLLAANGASVTVIGQTFRETAASGLRFVKADLSSMAEAQRVARELPAETADILILTADIFAGQQWQETMEGLELDMAVSFLNRLVMLREMAPRLGTTRPVGAARARVFNMAFPGGGQLGTPDDLNAERGYKAMPQHMNTVAGNEALSLDAMGRYPHLDSFGLNPGLVPTNIRRNLLGKSRFFGLIERMIGLFNPTPKQYAARIVPLILSPDLAGRSGKMFNKQAQAIRPSKGMAPDYVASFLTASEALVARALKGLCCTNPIRDSSCESGVIAGGHEQTGHTDLQDAELARV